jgi:hypothetical protein
MKAYEELAARHPDVPEVAERFGQVLAEAGATTRARHARARAAALRAR